MPAYPTCIICHGTESELDLSGVCTTCLSRGSGKEPQVTKGTKSTIPPAARTIVENETKTADSSPVDSATATLVKPEKSSPPVNLPTVRFTNYTNLEYIDRGGMGVVYKALQVNADRIVALKIMNAVAQSDSRQERRFKTEGQALARLSHPGIVQIYDVDEEQGLPYFSMEYVPGGSLSKRMRNGKPLSHREAAEMVAGVASALAAAHAQKIVHRDIKPSNILLTEIGKPKVTDFGLAAFFDQSARMTTTGAMLGTPAYMSPEQAAGKYGEVGPLSDVYSIGATLYELLTGRPPFSASTPMATAIKVCNERVIRPRAINPTIPADLEAICLKCLEKDPRDRYPSAAALANDLTRYLRGEPITSQTMIQKLKRSVRRNKVAVAAGILFLMTSVAAIAMLPDEPKKEVEKKLKKGEKAVLVQHKGWPKYYRWAMGDETPSVRDKGEGDGAAHFTAKGTSYLELCNDTITDKFTVEATLQHEMETTLYNGQIGLYLEMMDGTMIHRFITAQFSDYSIAPPEVPEMNQKPRVKLVDRLCIFFPTYEIIADHYINKAIIYSANAAYPKPWRTIAIHVDPNEMKIAFINMEPDIKNENTTHELSAHSTWFQKVNQEWRKAIDSKTEAKTRPFPGWSSRCRVGIFAQDSTVAFKNVFITPNP